jgi:hypothetical protein
MRVLELFAGNCSFSNVAKEFGYETITTDIKQNENNTIDYEVDIFDFDYKNLPRVDIIWASPPCTFFSVASIGKHWHKDNTPKSNEAIVGLQIIKKTIEIIDYLGANYWIIENPRGKLRKLEIMKDLPRSTVTYCQYGGKRMKPTDLWHNIDWQPKPMCKNGMSCHEAAPRGSSKGTYRDLYGASVPHDLCKEILDIINR